MTAGGTLYTVLGHRLHLVNIVCSLISMRFEMLQVVDGQVQCPYHGWEYNKGGECTKMPSTAFCSGVRVSALPCLEKDGEHPGYVF
jgi:phenylpropionate dioxygenase-like ring-hydroxylating dioxygenase large terminal subunit